MGPVICLKTFVHVFFCQCIVEEVLGNNLLNLCIQPRFPNAHQTHPFRLPNKILPNEGKIHWGSCLNLKTPFLNRYITQSSNHVFLFIFSNKSGFTSISKYHPLFWFLTNPQTTPPTPRHRQNIFPSSYSQLQNIFPSSYSQLEIKIEFFSHLISFMSSVLCLKT
eukprot:TRINITY_DN35907_c0_g1_i1.p1 TRINITY_DN35907_c0_g1~~TRINITY_DN35907_c0_g1_i1.p1  ORF type:complete len:165 (-),score=7.85 TRINITY_DN35907_c0_g1_i1:489-983(-)